MPARSPSESWRASVGGDLEGDPSLEIRASRALEERGAGDLSLRAAERHLARRSRSAACGARSPRPSSTSGAGRRSGCAQPVRWRSRRSSGVLPRTLPRRGRPRDRVRRRQRRVSPGATVGAFAVVGERSVVGDGAVLHPHVFVGARLPGGRGSEWPSPARGAEGARGACGRRVDRPPEGVLGSRRLRVRASTGRRHRKIPQVGRVVVEDDVEIGANVAVDRATLRRDGDRPWHEDRQPGADWP